MFGLSTEEVTLWPQEGSEGMVCQDRLYLLSQNFLRCKLDLNVYIIRMTDSLLLLVLYVDDLLITGCSTSVIIAVKRILHDRFMMTDMGPLHFFLGIEISQDASGIKLSQAKYAPDLLERFHMIDYKSAPNPFLSGVKLKDGGETPLVDGHNVQTTSGELVVSHTFQTKPLICSWCSFQVHAGVA
jgi:hypothetical protein